MTNSSEKNGRSFAIIFVFNERKLLLGWKKRKYGENKFYGYGGKVEAGESIRGAAIRELLEESGLEVAHPQHLEPRAVLRFDNKYQNLHGGTMYLFAARFGNLGGVLQESEEMRPEWVNLDPNVGCNGGGIPYWDMWPDSKIWMPLLITGKHFSAHFTYSQDGTIADYGIIEKESAPFDPDEIVFHKHN